MLQFFGEEHFGSFLVLHVSKPMKKPLASRMCNDCKGVLLLLLPHLTFEKGQEVGEHNISITVLRFLKISYFEYRFYELQTVNGLTPT